VRGCGGADSYEVGVITKTLKKQGGAASLPALRKARLAALYQLIASGIVERVLELSLGPATKVGITVRFEGRRRSRDASEPAGVAGVIDRAGQAPFSEAKRQKNAKSW
jgi:hypothetical protein